MVDRFSKYAVFMATPSTCTAEVIADLFYKNVVKYFGWPETLASLVGFGQFCLGCWVHS